jgi:hypothetical protein
MSGLQLRRLAIAVVVLLALWGMSALFAHRSDQVRGSLVLPVLTPTLTDTIVIIHGRDTVRLAQVAPGVWTANGFPAAPGKGSELLKAIGDTSPRDIASVSASSLQRVGLDSAAWILRVGPAQTPRLTLLIGNPGEEYGTAFVRLPRSDTAYLWRGTMPSLVRRVPDIWRDHHIASVAPDSIQSIEIGLHGKRFAVERQGKSWSVGGQKADSTKVRVLLAQFRTLDSQGFGGPHTADSLRRAHPRGQRTVTVRGKGSKPLLALTLDSASGSFWGTKSGDSTVYRLDNWQVIQLTPAADSLRAHH